MTYVPPGGVDQPQGPGFQGPPLASGLAYRRRWRPGRIWYVPALGILAAGIAWLVFGLASVTGTIDGLQRVPVPGTGTVSLAHGGGYTLYYEGPGAGNGDVPSFHINVAPVSPGTAVTSLTQYQTTVTYNIGAHEGRAVFSLRVTRPGRFAVTTTGTVPAHAELAIGGSIGSGIVTALLPAIPLIIVGVLAWLVLLIVRLVGKRSLPRAYA